MELPMSQTQAIDSKCRQQSDYLNEEFKYYRASPKNALLTSYAKKLWIIDKKWAVASLIETMPRELARSIFNQYVKKWEMFALANDSACNANTWLHETTEKTRIFARHFPVPINDLYFDSGRKTIAKIWCDRCVAAITECAEQKMSVVKTREVIKKIAEQWDFLVKDSKRKVIQLDGEKNNDFEIRKADELAWLSIVCLIDQKWWERQINTAFRQFYEHCQIINGRVHKGASSYLSKHGLKDFQTRKVNTQLAMSQLVALNNETGQEIEMLDVIKGTIANPEIRHHELMCRLRGFEDIANENGLMGGFFTLTAPSKFHAFSATKSGKSAYLNKKYEGASPKETQEYLCSVWAKSRAKLKRLQIELIGFRVCEPHHDGTPHWHALLFFRPEHELLIRYVLADYFTQDERDELNICNDDFLLWGKVISASDSLVVGEVDMEIFKSNKKITESLFKRINARFDYKVIDNEKGSATGYLAKYVSNNIDGINLESKDDTPTNRLAELACGWSSTWRIRQFQQIGGPPVSVWRELRRLKKDEEKSETKEKKDGDKRSIKGEGDLIEMARIAADSSNWSMFIEAMGGLFCTRVNFPVAMVYKPIYNVFGEVVKKLKGVGCFNKTMLTRSDDWSIVNKNKSRNEVDHKGNRSSTLGVLSLTVREHKTHFAESSILDQVGELSLLDHEFEEAILTLGGPLFLSDCIVAENEHC